MDKINSRTHILVSILFVIIILFLARLFYLQVIRHDHYVALANNEQLKSLTIPAKRGEIYALNGSKPVPLVMNQIVYTVFADPELIDNPDRVVDSVKEIAGGNARRSLKELVTKPNSRYQVLAKNLTRKQADKLKEEKLRGVGFHEESKRVYPEGTLAAQTLGFVNADGVGNYGVESAMNSSLSGEDGQLKTVTDIRDVPLTIGSQNINMPAKDGDNVVLSIDRNVQAYTEDALKRGLDNIDAKNGSVLVMNPANGKVLAMANYPSYDPANYGKAKSAALYNNDVISDPYEPASVVKSFTMAAGIDRGVITPQSTYINTDSVKIGDIVVHNAYRGLTGKRTMQEVLNHSLNTGTVTVARRLGDGKHITKKAREIIYDYFYNRFHLGRQTGIELANESTGVVVSPDNVQGGPARYSNMTFGQGLDVTMLQVAAGFSAVVNGGVYNSPTVVDGTYNNGIYKKSGDKTGERVIKKDTSRDVRVMLRKAHNSVAWMESADRSGYNIGGKTGTAETLKNGRYVQSQTVGTYLGFGGQDMPAYVIMVRVESPGKNLMGGPDAEPIFADISNWMLDYLQIPPKGTNHDR